MEDLGVHRPASVIFQAELPVPVTNLEIYEHVYVLEQWLRRIAFASLVAKFGLQWRGALPGTLAKDLKRRLQQLRGRVHLHSDDGDNAIWLLTLEELRGLLIGEALWPMVKDLTQLPRQVVELKVDELREVRNIVGHNRATTRETAIIVEAITVALRPGIEHFKGQLLYEPHEVIYDDVPGEDPVQTLYAERLEGNVWSKFQPMLSSSEHFYSLTHLPVEPFENLAIKAYLREVRDVSRLLLAVLVNMDGAEFTLCWPKSAAPSDHARIVKFFFETRRVRWTQTEYERQSASAICDPLVWFYENSRPDEE